MILLLATIAVMSLCFRASYRHLVVNFLDSLRKRKASPQGQLQLEQPQFPKNTAVFYAGGTRIHLSFDVQADCCFVCS